MTREATESASALAAFAAQSDITRMPAHVVRTAKACLLYAVAVGIAARSAPMAAMIARALDLEYGEAGGPVTRMLDGRAVATGAGAYANAVLLHGRVQEDAHPAGHVGVVVVPAAIAMAQEQRASGPALLAALVVGYEVALRIGRDHVSDSSARGFRSTPLYGVFGAAAAAGRLAGLDDDRMADAICLAANFAGGLREFVTAGTDEFPLHAGMAARNGIHAVQCALTGVHAARSTIGGDAGFMRAFGEPGKAYSARLADALGEQFELVRTTYKPYPACQFNRSVIRGMLALRASHAAPLRGITIGLHPFEADFVGMRHTGPFVSFPQTFMSAPFCAALAWVDGAVTYRAMHDFDREPVVRLAARVRVVADASIPRYRPQLTIETADGRTLEWAEDQGEERYAMTWDAAVDMTRIFCSEAGVAPQDTDALIEATLRLDQNTDCNDFLSALRRAHARACA